MNVNIKKENCTYFFYDDEDTWARPYLSEDGLDMLICARTPTTGSYYRFLVAEIPKDEHECIYEAAAVLAMAYLMDRENE
jgi:hypothetical protein